MSINKKKVKPLYNHIKKFLNDEFKISANLTDNAKELNLGNLDSLLMKFNKNSKAFIFSEKSETKNYNGTKVLNDIDSLRIQIANELDKNSKLEINVIYWSKIEIGSEEGSPGPGFPPPTPPSKKLDTLLSIINQNLASGKFDIAKKASKDLIKTVGPNNFQIIKFSDKIFKLGQNQINSSTDCDLIDLPLSYYSVGIILSNQNSDKVKIYNETLEKFKKKCKWDTLPSPN
jgi:hypothetical protein